MQIARFTQNAHMSKVVCYNGTAYLSAQVADDPSQDFSGQVSQILQKIQSQLESVDSHKNFILSATAYIDDYRKWGEFNEVWDRWVEEGHKPTRTCVEAKLAFPQYQVEVSVIAACATPSPEQPCATP